MTLASVARHLGKKCYILLLPEEGLDGEALYGETQHPSTLRGYSEVFGIGDSESGFAPLSEKALSCPWREELDLIFLAVGISGLRPLCSLLSTVPGGARLSCRLMNSLVSFLPGAEILHRRLPVPRDCVSSGVQNIEHLFAPCSFPGHSHQ